ncbi:hypothetical protein ACFSS8_19740 [Paracoccus kondratievae]
MKQFAENGGPRLRSLDEAPLKPIHIIAVAASLGARRWMAMFWVSSAPR